MGEDFATKMQGQKQFADSLAAELRLAEGGMQKLTVRSPPSKGLSFLPDEAALQSVCFK